MDNAYEAFALLPSRLRLALTLTDNNTKRKITEIRIRKNGALIIYILNTPYFITESGKLVNHIGGDCIIVENEEFSEVVDRACASSFHTKVDTMIKGYVTTQSGSRIGVASTAVYKEKDVFSVKDITSLNIRIAREIINCSRPVLNTLYVNNTPSIIVAGPPSGGKTTFLRDAAKILSSGFAGKYRKVCVIDEREEIATGFDVGINTDIIRSFSKAQGIENAVRAMSPDIIICDEIGNEQELSSIRFGFSSGISFIVSVHARSRSDLLNRSIIKKLIEQGEFEYIVLLKDYTNDCEIYNIAGEALENGRIFNDNAFFDYDIGGNSII